MEQQEIKETINRFFVDTLEYEEKNILPESYLKSGLGMTSLDVVETALFIRRTFGFQPQVEDMQKLCTLGDLYEYIEQHQQQE